MAPMVARNGEKSKTKTLTLSDAALRLEVTKGHLSRVLRGERVSKSLTHRYRQLLKKAA